MSRGRTLGERPNGFPVLSLNARNVYVRHVWDYNHRMVLVKPQGTYSTIVINEWKKVILEACINTTYINQQSKSDSSEMVLLLFLLCVYVYVYVYSIWVWDKRTISDEWLLDWWVPGPLTNWFSLNGVGQQCLFKFKPNLHSNVNERQKDHIKWMTLCLWSVQNIFNFTFLICMIIISIFH